MIRSFADSETEKLFNRERNRLPADIQRRAQRKLEALNAATSVTDLRNPPGNRLEQLKGDREGQHSIRVNDQYRVCFRWDGQDAYDVEVTDYH